MFTMSIYALIPATVVITSKTRGQILAGRILNCKHGNSLHFPYLYQVIEVTDLHPIQDVYIGFELSVVPVFQSEIVPGPARGFVVSTYQLSLNVSPH